MRTMPFTCSAINCTTRNNKGSRNNIYRFPLKNKALCKQWVAALQRDAWTPTPSSFLCSKHFDESCFKKVDGQRQLLEKAVPTIFDSSKPVPKVTPRNRRGVKRLYMGDIVQCEEDVDDPETIGRSSELHLKAVTGGNSNVTAGSDESMLVDHATRTSEDLNTSSNASSDVANLVASGKAIAAALQVLQNGKDEVDLLIPDSCQSFKIIKIPSKTPACAQGTATSGRNVLKPLNQQPLAPDIAVWIKAVEAALKCLQTSKHDFVLLKISSTAPALKVLKLPVNIPSGGQVAKQNSLSTNSSKTDTKVVPKYQAKCQKNVKELKLAEQLNKRQKKKIEMLERKITSQQKKIQSLKEGPVTLQQSIQALKHHLNENIYEFVLAQLPPDGKKMRHANVWRSEIKDLFLAVYSDSPRAYRMMNAVFELPSKSTLRLHENQLKELMHLEYEISYTTTYLDKNRKQIVFDDDENEKVVTLIKPKVEQSDETASVSSEIEESDERNTEASDICNGGSLTSEETDSSSQTDFAIVEEPHSVFSIEVVPTSSGQNGVLQLKTGEREDSISQSSRELLHSTCYDKSGSDKIELVEDKTPLEKIQTNENEGSSTTNKSPRENFECFIIPHS